MRRVVLTGVAGAAAAGVAGATAGASTRRSSASANVLWIITDDQPRRLVTHMPTVMSRIARKGAHFTSGYAAVPWCGPARASMLTSRYPGNHLCRDNDTHRPFVDQGHDQDTVATRMAAAGYRNGYFGTYTNGDRQDPGYVAPGWDLRQPATRPKVVGVSGLRSSTAPRRAGVQRPASSGTPRRVAARP